MAGSMPSPKVTRSRSFSTNASSVPVPANAGAALCRIASVSSSSVWAATNAAASSRTSRLCRVCSLSSDRLRSTARVLSVVEPTIWRGPSKPRCRIPDMELSER